MRLERLEDRTVPSSSIQLTGLGVKPIGPGIVEGTSAAQPALTNAGRINAIAAAPVPFDASVPGYTGPTDPTDPTFELWNTYFVATPGGGVARTKDGGKNWQFLTDNLPVSSWGNNENNRNLSIGAIDISPLNRNLVFAGTGDAFGGNYGFAGRGLLRSLDGGDTWSLNKGPGNEFDGAAFKKFIFHPTNVNVIYAVVESGGTTRYGFAATSSVYRTTDSGTNWVRITTNTGGAAANGNFVSASGINPITDFILDPTSPNVGYVAIQNYGVLRTNNLQTGTGGSPTYNIPAVGEWSVVLGGTGTQLPGGSYGQIRLAFGLGTPSQPSRIYALSTSLGGTSTQLFRSDDSGINFRRLDPFPGNFPNSTNITPSNGIYNLTLVADPTTPNRLYVGGRGNGSIQVLTNADYDPDNPTTLPNWVNLTFTASSGDTFPVVRDLRFDNTGAKDINGRPINPGRLLIATDSGVYRLEAPSSAITTNANFTGNNLVLTNLNGNVGTTALAAQQVFATAIAPRDDNRVIAGTYLNGTAIYQDNGPFAATDVNYQGLYGWDATSGAGTRGSGGNAGFNQLDPTHVYRVSNNNNEGFVTAQGGLFQRSTDLGNTWTTSTTGIVNPTATFSVVPFEVNPSPQVGTTNADMVLGTDVINRSSDDGQTWSQYWSNIRWVTGTGAVVSTVGLGRQLFPFAPSYPLYVASNRRVGVNTINGPAIYRATLGPNGEQWWTDITPGTNTPGATNPFVTENFPGTEPPDNDLSFLLGSGGTITDIAIDPTDSRIMVFTVDTPGFNAAGDRRIYRTTNAGNTWTDISGSLPASNAGVTGLRVYSVALDPNRLIVQPGNTASPSFQQDDDLYIGTSIGVYKLTDPTTSTTWTRLFGTGSGVTTGTDQVAGALPDVMVRDVKLNTTTGILSVSTFGRGVWQTQIRPYIRGLVYSDFNGNGTNNANDTKLGGAVVVANDIVPNPSVQFANATTTANGEWVFRSLPDSTYQFIPSDASTNLVDTGTRYYFTSSPIVTAMNQTKTINGQDLYLFRRVSIAGRVYEDANGNGSFDTGENPAVGYVVSLFAPAGTLNPGATLVATVTTDANGNYTFLGVGPLRPDAVGPSTPFAAGYQVAVNKSGYQMIETPGQTGALTSGLNLTDALNQGQTRVGVFRYGQISGTVFGDNNGDGAFNGIETGKAGWVVNILDANNNNAFIASTVTDANGNYIFGNLTTSLKASNYNIQLVDKTGFVQTTGTIPTLPVISGTNTKGINIGVFKAAAISGTAFEDVNGDGIRQPSETTNLAGVTISVFDPRTNTEIANAVTDGSGNYTISNLFPLSVPGNATPYRVRYTLPAGSFTQTIVDPSVTLTSATTTTGINIPLFVATTVSGFAFEDTNGNGVQDPGEGGLAGGSVSLLNSSNNAVVYTTSTDSNGNFTFTDVGPIPGPVAFRLGANPVGFVQTTPNPADFFLTSNTPVSGFSIGLFRLATFSGLVFDDINGNGVLDNGEAGIAGRTVQLVDNTGSVIRVVATASDGTYTVQAGTGIYSVRLQAIPGYVQTTTNPGDTATTSGLSTTNQNFGSFQLTTITGRVYNDVNGNGILDSEPGLANFTIQLVNAATGAVVATTTTDNTGFFIINGVGPGNFTVRVILQNGFVASPISTQNFTAFSGTPATFSFGAFQLTTISGNVYEDLNSSGTFNTGDIASAGWTIQVVRPGGLVFATVVTDANGNFTVGNVPPGTYTVRILNRTGYSVLNNGTQTVTITSGTPATINRIGVLKFGSITGNVFLDSNRNNTFNTFEKGLAGAVVILLDGNGAQVGSQTTDANGSYTFLGLRTATYTVRLSTFPSGFTSTGAATSRSVAVAVGSTNPANVVTGINFGLLGRKRYAVAADGGGGPRVQVYDAQSNTLLEDFFVYETEFTGGVRVASADVNGDGVDDLIVVPGAGGGPRIRVLSGVDKSEIYNYFAYEPSFINGLYVASADVDGDGFSDIITGTAPGGGPRVTIASGKTGLIIGDYFAFDSDFRGGVRVGAGDLNGDGIAELFAAQGPGGTSEVRVFSLSASVFRQTGSFNAFENGYSGGVYLSGSVPGTSGRSTIIVGSGIAYPTPVVRVFDNNFNLNAEVEAFPSGTSATPFASEVRAIGIDRNSDGITDLAIASGSGSPPRLRFVNGLNFQQLGDEIQPYETAFTGGVFIG
jgi:SdrD B-like domain